MGWAIALHGGAGNIPLTLPPERREPEEAALRHCLQMGTAALKAKQPPLDVVELVVRELENNPHFNAGRGSVLTSNGTVEMEACIMDGICKEQGVETIDPSHFITPNNIERLERVKEANRVQIDYTEPIQKEVEKQTPVADGDSQIGTVGCVAVDIQGNLAAATSTGGFVNKMVGRIGDTPIIGAGTYANRFCAVSATGKGEAIMRATVARDVAAIMEYKGLSLKDAADYVIQECAPRGTAGLVAVSATGEVTMPFNTTGMFRACATEDGYSEIGIWPSV
ncbi:hypothetical protein F0562_025042 [Nyssa sinensis]|uniref:beta-aspartyl-peptidase n=1 Tax=Nyssa sinensis TaxID=561372 RepID=A0A5J5BEE6_9ASTE|nr:hypothetical protein F0562_025042 [Nyssa sinensis]